MTTDEREAYVALALTPGIGAARLDGSRCLGCHLQIPAGEMVEVKAAPADAIVHCPECNRILVR